MKAKTNINDFLNYKCLLLDHCNYNSWRSFYNQCNVQTQSSKNSQYKDLNDYTKKMSLQVASSYQQLFRGPGVYSPPNMPSESDASVTSDKSDKVFLLLFLKLIKIFIVFYLSFTYFNSLLLRKQCFTPVFAYIITY